MTVSELIEYLSTQRSDALVLYRVGDDMFLLEPVEHLRVRREDRKDFTVYWKDRSGIPAVVFDFIHLPPDRR